MMKRVFLTVLDAVGCGSLPDSAAYGDDGANTLGHVIAACHPSLPNMAAMGLGHIASTGYEKDENAVCAFGRCMETSAGKDTTTGHWEIAGLSIPRAFPTFPDGFPAGFIKAYEKAIGYEVIGNYASSGTVILDQLGKQHMQARKPIVYTSADSVFQIACHEDVFSVEELYRFCEIAREMLQGDMAVGRVIARPFAGTPGSFKRTARRRDFSLPPIGPTLLDAVSKAGMETLAVGKIEDIFDHKGITRSNHAAGNPACIDAWVAFMKQDFNGLCFTNLVDTDMVYGHRRDVQGYADALAYIDSRIPEIKSLLGDEDLLIITADHGCDPTWTGTDHTREHIPLMIYHKGMHRTVDLGTRTSFRDIAATCAEWLGLPDRFDAKSFAKELMEA